MILHYHQNTVMISSHLRKRFGLYFKVEHQATQKKIRAYMGVSKDRGTPKCMVYNGKPY